MAKLFISYRHLGGAAMGQLLSDRLKAKRHSVFFDRDSLIAGKFPEKIYEAIKNCDCFLLILPERALDRCIGDPEDWVRREVRYALQCGKPIIPIFLRGFVFPDNLPQDIHEVTQYHGLSFEKMDCFEETVEKLCSILPRTGLRKGMYALGQLFVGLRKGTGKFLKFCWRRKWIRGAALFFLIFMILSSTIDVVRYANNTSVDQWIQAKTLYQSNGYAMNVPISPDNKRMAIYDGNRQIILSKVEGNGEETDMLGVLNTSFEGKPAGVAFQGSNHCFVICEGDVELFNLDKSPEPVQTLHFQDYDPDLFVNTCLWKEDFSCFSALWYDKSTGQAHHCSVYDAALGLRETFSIEDCRYLGSADAGRYLLFWDENQQCIRIIDTRECVEGTLETMGEACYEKIDQQEDTYWNFDKNGRYVLCYYPSWNDPSQTRVVVADLKTGREIYSGDYWGNGTASFDSEESFVIFHTVRDGEIELRRVRFLEDNDAFDVLLTEEELTRMLESGGEPFPQSFFHCYFFPDTEYMLIAYKQRLHLIDLEAKRRTASCNNLEVPDPYITGYEFINIKGNIITVVFSSETVPGEEYDYQWLTSQKQTVTRFSYDMIDGRVVVNEDAYAGERGLILDIFLLTAGITGLAFFLWIGHLAKKEDETEKGDI